jgi:DNA-binding NarL/FixJ family response regulator
MPGSVLIVDDDAAFRGLARRILTANGLSVVGEAGSIEAAATAAGALRPDAVLLDVMLPDGDGVAFAAELSALSWKPRVVLTSSYDDAASEDEIERSGAIAFVPKPELPTAPLERLLGRPPTVADLP